jgi:hypothetical protein
MAHHVGSRREQLRHATVPLEVSGERPRRALEDDRAARPAIGVAGHDDRARRLPPRAEQDAQLLRLEPRLVTEQHDCSITCGGNVLELGEPQLHRRGQPASRIRVDHAYLIAPSDRSFDQLGISPQHDNDRREANLSSKVEYVLQLRPAIHVGQLLSAAEAPSEAGGKNDARCRARRARRLSAGSRRVIHRPIVQSVDCNAGSTPVGAGGQDGRKHARRSIGGAKEAMP